MNDMNVPEEAPGASKAQLEHLLTISPAVIYICQPGGDFITTFISENVKRLLGYEPQEFVGKPRFMADRIHPEDAPHIFLELEALLEREYHTREYRFQYKDGTYRWMRDEIKLVRDPQGNDCSHWPAEGLDCG